jgi:hypothetical protein
MEAMEAAEEEAAALADPVVVLGAQGAVADVPECRVGLLFATVIASDREECP